MAAPAAGYRHRTRRGEMPGTTPHRQAREGLHQEKTGVKQYTPRCAFGLPPPKRTFLPGAPSLGTARRKKTPISVGVASSA